MKQSRDMCWLLRAADHERMVSAITAREVWWTWLPHSPKTNGDHLNKDNLGRYCVGGCCSSVAECWRLKSEALGSIPSSATFLSFPLPFQRSSDSNGPRLFLIRWSPSVFGLWGSPVHRTPRAVITQVEVVKTLRLTAIEDNMWTKLTTPAA